ncbi:hypothetical protein Dsin_013961 [Dipteronia sinensis]|uniref:Jacalin-type lectin domain-containing protein n=1 Tax=Dipteronia sinensis TaxID=43782 RepID=A0AAE0AL09_9ROSI|nr:hypothetical protein Dsin_013961 [Dipteronia sinensis]
MNVDALREAGPWGGNKGKSWDDGVFSAVEQVHVHVGNGMVHAVQFFYGSRDGKSVWSKMHGTGDGESLNRIKLDCSSEYLVGMMGFYGPIEENCGFEAITSVSFYTNKGKYGPFGIEIGTAFGSPATDGKIVGFHGRSGCYLDAIGVHVEYF